MIRSCIHLLLHFIVPGAVARWAYPEKWKKAWVIMLATMLVDLDHLLAEPIFDPYRCGVGFHPLHSYYAIIGYVVLAIIGKTRIVGIGLLIHMALDGLDCLWINYS